MTLGADLERDRLTRRARRVRAVIVALRRQAGGEHAEAGISNQHMFRAISEFEGELTAIEARLRDLEPRVSWGDELPRDWTTT